MAQYIQLNKHTEHIIFTSSFLDTLFLKISDYPDQLAPDDLMMPADQVPHYLGLDVRKPVFGSLRTTKAQTSLRIPAV